MELIPMDSRLIITDSRVTEIATALAAASGKWTGCDWPTQFGQNRLNLKGLQPSQALLMERATAGSEAADWHDAVIWLRRVEQEAHEAESEAQTAARLARSGRFPEALEGARRACGIESRYHKSLVWQPLFDAIEAALSEVDGNKPSGQQLDN
jgi:hypothetical protein